ncbi:hypothetical protein C0J52_15101 [Blattella germanica]|nr:hypothetical protein C0J52_15101 [Blattella germanica]
MLVCKLRNLITWTASKYNIEECPIQVACRHKKNRYNVYIFFHIGNRGVIFVMHVSSRYTELCQPSLSGVEISSERRDMGILSTASHLRATRNSFPRTKSAHVSEALAPRQKERKKKSDTSMSTSFARSQISWCNTRNVVTW